MSSSGSDEIPLLDLQGLAENEEHLQNLAKQIKEAFVKTGFVAVTNHNISTDLVSMHASNFSLARILSLSDRERSCRRACLFLGTRAKKNFTAKVHGSIIWESGWRVHRSFPDTSKVAGWFNMNVRQGQSMQTRANFGELPVQHPATISFQIDKVWKKMESFFQLPEEEKSKTTQASA